MTLLSTVKATVTMWALGDLVGQRMERGSSYSFATHDYYRTLRLLSFALLFASPLSTMWYEHYMVGWEMEGHPDGSLSNTLMKVFLDQTLWSIPMTILLFTYTTLLEGGTLSLALHKVRKDLFPTLKTQWLLWPLVQLINFTLIPEDQRILLVNIVSVPWTAYLANRTSNKASSSGSTARAD